MQISVTHVYSSKNKGDTAILACQLRELERVFSGASFDIRTLARSEQEREFEGRVLDRSLMSTVVGAGAPRPLRPLLGLTMMASTAAWAALKRGTGWDAPLPARWRDPLRALAASDAQVCVGGGYLRGVSSTHSTYLLSLLVHQIVLGHLLGKPVYLYAQSFGPFYGKAQELCFRIACSCSALVLPRESISNDVAERATRAAGKVMQVIDTAFLVERAQPADLAAWFPQGRPPVVVGVTARKWLAGDGQLRYEEGLAELVSDILARGWGVVVIPQVTAEEHGDDDRTIGRALKQRFGDQANFVAIEDDLPLPKVLGLYASLDYLVGTRFHSVIFCLCAGVPCLAIEYEHKTSGILRDLGLAEWCIRIEDVTADALRTRFARLVGDRDRVVGQIGRAVEQARERARMGAAAIAADLGNRAPREGKGAQVAQPTG